MSRLKSPPFAVHRGSSECSAARVPSDSLLYIRMPYFRLRRRSGEGRKPLAGLPDSAEGEEEDGAEAGPAASSLPHTQRGAARTITLLSAERVNAIIAKVDVLSLHGRIVSLLLAALLFLASFFSSLGTFSCHT